MHRQTNRAAGAQAQVELRARGAMLSTAGYAALTRPTGMACSPAMAPGLIEGRRQALTQA